MAQYLISYLDGETETITASGIETGGVQYVLYQDGKPAAFIPVTNVRSVIRQDDEAVDA
jgi:hypothetical protein